jgi:hypothetical protein
MNHKRILIYYQSDYTILKFADDIPLPDIMALLEFPVLFAFIHILHEHEA